MSDSLVCTECKEGCLVPLGFVIFISFFNLLFLFANSLIFFF